MKLNGDTSNDKPFELCPEGTHPAICYRVVDLGTHPVEGQFAFDKNGNQKFSRKLTVYFEVPGELMSDGRPFGVQETFTASLGDKSKLRAILKTWIGEKALEDFDTSSLVCRNAMISVAHRKSADGKTYANLTGVLPLPKGMTLGMPKNEAFSFDIDNWDDEAFGKLTKYASEKIKNSLEYKQRFLAKAETSMSPDGDIPF